MRGCPFGGYFSSVSSTLPWAESTGNLAVRPHSVVHSIQYDETADYLGIFYFRARNDQITSL